MITLKEGLLNKKNIIDIDKGNEIDSLKAFVIVPLTSDGMRNWQKGAKSYGISFHDKYGRLCYSIDRKHFIQFKYIIDRRIEVLSYPDKGEFDLYHMAEYTPEKLINIQPWVIKDIK